MRARLLILAAGGLVALIGLSGCVDGRAGSGGGSVVTSADGVGVDSVESGSSTTLVAGSVQSTGRGAVSPLNRAFVTLEESNQEEWDESVFQEYVAECMRKEGFDYWPHVEEPTDERSDWERPIFPLGEDSVSPSSDLVDPNSEYRESLTESERRAYLVALTGQDPDVAVVEGDPEGDSDVDATGGSGCEGESRRRYEAELEASAGDESAEATAALFAQLDEAVNQMIGELESDGEVVTALAEYSGCLADAGFPAQFPSSAHDTVYWMPVELVAYLQEQGADLVDAVASNPGADPVELIGPARVDELTQLEEAARQAHADCVQPLEEAVRSFEIEYARSDPTLNQYLTDQ